MTKNKVYDILSLVRYKNLLILIFTQSFLFFVLLNEFVNVQYYALLLSTVFAAAGGNIVNDYYDIEADAVNKPFKTSNFTAKQLLIWYGVCVCISISLIYFLPLEAGALILLNNILLWLYSRLFKQLPLIGNIVVGYLAASALMLFLLVYHEAEQEILVFSIFTFFIHLIRELIKDIEDVKGDSIAGYKTLPIVTGESTAKWAVIVVELIFVPLLLFLSVRLTTSLLLYNMVVSMPLLVIIFIKTIRAKNKESYKSISNWCKLLMLFGVLGMLFC